ncbi:hypothetical protein IQ06DRAFT_210 [Phaeosphaeriaceae sp. SRC1lsM3a]|nr:hypothetical protein IQ06DRAFT_210 [Stagonospora sp. SRC1lsM3a]
MLINRDFVTANFTSHTNGGSTLDDFLLQDHNDLLPAKVYEESLRLSNMYRDGKLARLNTTECITTYAATYQTHHGSVLVVKDMQGAASFDDIRNYDQGMRPNWMCNPDQTWGIGSCNSLEVIKDIITNVNGWRPLSASAPILYCLSEKLSIQRCKLQSSLHIMIIVIAFIAAMSMVMALLVYRDDEKPLLTIGDAIVSFLQDPDRWTQDMCLASYKDFQV